MSWKAVEMQVAMPRVVDAAQMQEQMSQRGQTMQSHVVQTQQSETHINRNKVNKTDTFNSLTHATSNSSLQDEKEEPTHHHPYLGQSIDTRG